MSNLLQTSSYSLAWHEGRQEVRAASVAEDVKCVDPVTVTEVDPDVAAVRGVYLTTSKSVSTAQADHRALKHV